MPVEAAERPEETRTHASVGLYAVDLGEVDLDRTPCETYALTPQIARLVLLAQSGRLGNPAEAAELIRAELVQAVDSGEVPEYFRELLSAVDAQSSAASANDD